MNETQEAHDEQALMQIIDSLPQRAHLSDERIRAWIEATRKADPDRLLWHAERLRGIGGSEIGDLLAAERGAFAWQTPRDIVASKLMMDAPTASSGDTARGTTLEPIVQEDFRRRYGARPATDVLRALEVSAPNPERPWRVGNPDDLLWIGSKLTLVDYKVPRTEGLRETLRNGAPLGYAAQLHHYAALIRERLGVEVEQLILAPFDTNAWRSHALEVPMSEALLADLDRVGEQCWRQVLDGELPELAEKGQRITMPPAELPDAFRDSLRRAAAVKALNEASESAYDDLRGDLEYVYAQQFGRPDVETRYAGMVIKTTAKTSLDLAAAVDALRERGFDLREVEHQGLRRYDPNAVEVALGRAGLDPQRYITVHHGAQLGVTRARKGEEAEYRKKLKKQAATLLEKSGMTRPLPTPEK